jgi:hypothetical protein
LEEYNRPFSLNELRKSLDKAHDTACGPDDIHYQLLEHLPESALQTLLDLMDDIWETGDLPSICKLANVVDYLSTPYQRGLLKCHISMLCRMLFQGQKG